MTALGKIVRLLKIIKKGSASRRRESGIVQRGGVAGGDIKRDWEPQLASQRISQYIVYIVTHGAFNTLSSFDERIRGRRRRESKQIAGERGGGRGQRATVSKDFSRLLALCLLPAKGGENQYTYIARRVVCHQLLVLDGPPFLSLPYTHTHTLCSIYVRMGRGGETNIQVLRGFGVREKIFSIGEEDMLLISFFFPRTQFLVDGI